MLSKDQKKILKLLTLNARYTNKDIASAAGVSEDTVRYQIEKLLDKEQLGFLYTRIDYYRLGYFDTHYLIRLKDPNNVDYEALGRLPEITFMNSSWGKYDLQLIIVVQQQKEVNNIIDNINDILGENVQDFAMFQATKCYTFTSTLPDIQVEVTTPTNRKNKLYRLNSESYSYAVAGEDKLDAQEKQIIRCILKRPRMSYTELVERTGFARETIKHRIERLVRDKVISAFTFNPHYQNLDMFTTYVVIKLRRVNDRKFEAYFHHHKHIFYAARTTGSYSLIFYAATKSREEFGSIVDEIKEKFKDDIIDTELLYFHDIHKYVEFPMQALE